MMLHHKGEGQWLIPGLCQPDRWEADKKVVWSSVQAVWSRRIKMVEELVGTVKLVIEKSPPNLVRASQLLEQFPKHEQIVFNRNPYANCASALYRNHAPAQESEEHRIKILRNLALKWVSRSTYAKQQIDVYHPVRFTYEEFCQNPDQTLKQTIERIPLLSGLNSDLSIKVKDYTPQKITDQNKRQISNLSAREREAIGSTLQPHEELLNAFGYTSDWRTDVEQGGAHA